MQATGTLQGARASKGFILVVVAMLCALLLGAAGGYAARSASQTSGGAAQTVQANAPNSGLLDRGADRGGIAGQGSPQSDLTRALPTSAPADPAAGYDISQWTGSNAANSAPDHGLIP